MHFGAVKGYKGCDEISRPSINNILNEENANNNKLGSEEEETGVQWITRPNLSIALSIKKSDGKVKRAH